MKDEIVKGLREVAEEALEEVSKKSKTAGVDRWGRRVMAGKKMNVTSELNTAMRHDNLRPVKDYLRKSGYSWSRFVNERVSKDPNLSKLGQKARQRRVAELWEQLGEDGFKTRFNL